MKETKRNKPFKRTVAFIVSLAMMLSLGTTYSVNKTSAYNAAGVTTECVNAKITSITTIKDNPIDSYVGSSFDIVFNKSISGISSFKGSTGTLGSSYCASRGKDYPKEGGDYKLYDLEGYAGNIITGGSLGSESKTLDSTAKERIRKALYYGFGAPGYMKNILSKDIKGNNINEAGQKGIIGGTVSNIANNNPSLADNPNIERYYYAIKEAASAPKKGVVELSGGGKCVDTVIYKDTIYAKSANFNLKLKGSAANTSKTAKVTVPNDCILVYNSKHYTKTTVSIPVDSSGKSFYLLIEKPSSGTTKTVTFNKNNVKVDPSFTAIYAVSSNDSQQDMAMWVSEEGLANQASVTATWHDLTINKVSSDNKVVNLAGYGLDGTVIGIYKGSNLIKKCTVHNGKISITLPASGNNSDDTFTYKYKEISVPDDSKYEVDDNSYSVSLKASNVVKTLTNNPKSTSVKVIKEKYGANGKSLSPKEYLANAVIIFSFSKEINDNGVFKYPIKNKYGESNNSAYTGDGSDYETVIGFYAVSTASSSGVTKEIYIPKGKTLYMQEIIAPAGYSVNKTPVRAKTTIKNQKQTSENTIGNTEKSGRIKIVKTGEVIDGINKQSYIAVYPYMGMTTTTGNGRAWGAPLSVNTIINSDNNGTWDANVAGNASDILYEESTAKAIMFGYATSYADLVDGTMSNGPVYLNGGTRPSTCVSDLSYRSNYYTNRFNSNGNLTLASSKAICGKVRYSVALNVGETKDITDDLQAYIKTYLNSSSSRKITAPADGHTKVIKFVAYEVASSDYYMREEQRQIFSVTIDSEGNIVAGDNDITFGFENNLIEIAINVEKQSSNSNITNNNSCYSLNGAEYGLYSGYTYKNGVYTGSGLIETVKLVTGTDKTKATGSFKETSYQFDKEYYLIETKNPPGYKLDTTPYYIS